MKLADRRDSCSGDQFISKRSSLAGVSKQGKPKNFKGGKLIDASLPIAHGGETGAFSKILSNCRVHYFVYFCTIFKCLGVDTHN